MKTLGKHKTTILANTFILCLELSQLFSDSSLTPACLKKCFIASSTDFSLHSIFGRVVKTPSGKNSLGH